MSNHRSGERYRDLADRLRAAVLEGEGETDPALRAAVEHRAASLGGRGEPSSGDVPAPQLEGEPGDVPELLKPYVDTVALHAYRVTDDDILRLREAGHSQDEIFELTVSAAVGAGMGRLERAYAALRGEV